MEKVARIIGPREMKGKGQKRKKNSEGPQKCPNFDLYTCANFKNVHFCTESPGKYTFHIENRFSAKLKTIKRHGSKRTDLTVKKRPFLTKKVWERKG